MRGWIVACAVLAVAAAGGRAEEKVLRAGIIGADTSHAVAFTKLLNDPAAPEDVSGVRVVAVYPGGSPDIPDSADRVGKFTKELRDEYKVEVVDSVEALLKKVDVVLLESVDGRPHLEQARPVLAAKKPVFIDKPVAGSLADVVQIYHLAAKYGTPVFSSSALRFGANVQAARNDTKVGDILGCDAYSPCHLEPHHPDLFWYGIHGVEELFTLMGTGCESVTRVQTRDVDLVTGKWKGGRVGSYRGLRAGKQDYGAVTFGSKGIGFVAGFGGYRPLVVEIVKFFKTGRPPVSAEETVEIYAFMEAADESKRRGGVPVTLAAVLARARQEAGLEKKEGSGK